MIGAYLNNVVATANSVKAEIKEIIQPQFEGILFNRKSDKDSFEPKEKQAKTEGDKKSGCCCGGQCSCGCCG